MLSKCLLKFSIKVFADFGLRSGSLVDPESDLIRELLIVESSGKKSFFDQIKLNLLRPLVRLEIAVYLVISDILGEAWICLVGRGVRLQENFTDSEVEFFVLDLIKGYVNFILNGSLEVKILGITDHSQGNFHRKL